jgi:translation initiation factor 2B subunit (eIF-2B alpha/beta/delta family)
VSDNERSEVLAFRELSTLVRHLGDELASFRKRALSAEARVKAMEASGSMNTEGLAERVAQLEAENTDLRTRLDAARGRARHMLERVRFLRQQQEGGR